MNLDDIRTLVRFNNWANRSLLDALASIPEEPYFRDLGSSYGGIHGTLIHLVGAEKVWLERWLGQLEAKLLPPSEAPTLAAARAIWEEVSGQRDAFLTGFTEEKLQEKFTMKTLSGATFVHPYWQMFQHVVNHSSYHRGQIVTLMRQVGARPPSTDLINFYREQA